MNGKTIYRVTIGGRDHYFGSLTAIYDVFTPDEIGCKVQRLWDYGITQERPFRNSHCEIHKGELHRHTTKRKLPTSNK